MRSEKIKKKILTLEVDLHTLQEKMDDLEREIDAKESLLESSIRDLRELKDDKNE